MVRAALRVAGLDEDPRVRVAVPVSMTLRADVRRLRQVLLNLLSNASRHTPPDGEIEVVVAATGGEARLTVSNTGSHLTAEECARVFDRFYRTDPSRQKTTGGTGLGLAIVKHLVEAHGGTIQAHSGPGDVTFDVRLPARSDTVTS